MTLSEQMQNMMDEMRAIKLLTNSIKNDLENEISVNGVKKIANLMVMIEGLHIPDIVSSFEDIENIEYFDDQACANILENNIAAGIVHCRLKYWRVPKRMPSSVEGMSHYWKDYYNAGGKVNPDEFVEQVTKWLR